MQERGFLADRSGNIAMLFAFMLVPVVATLGMAIDYGHALQERTNLQAALDAAVLAAGREYQTTGSVDAALSKAIEFFNEVAPANVAAEVTAHSVDQSTSTITMGVAAEVPTSFLRIMRVNSVSISTIAKASLANGGGNNELEVAMMLDITGSMAGQKLSDLKSAAKDLVQILLPDQNSERHARISLVPFSASVNPGSYRTVVRGPDLGGNSGASYGCSANSTGGWRKLQCYRNTSNALKDATRTNCVSERTGPEAFSDTSPFASSGRVNAAYGATCPAATLMPLTSDKDALQASIDGYAAGGWTAGQIGTAWAWYTLSPEWNGVWPGVNEAAAYGAERVMKIAVLMTDGEYNTEYANFVRAHDQRGDPSPLNGRSDAQARSLCQAMKARGIVVYTVGFQLDDANAVSTLQDCATDQAHAFLATDGNELKMAFRNIAFQLAQLRLSQ